MLYSRCISKLISINLYLIPPIGSTVFTYKLSDDDEGRYSINPATGLITFISSANMTENTTYGVGATATDLTAPNQESKLVV